MKLLLLGALLVIAAAKSKTYTAVSVYNASNYSIKIPQWTHVVCDIEKLI